MPHSGILFHEQECRVPIHYNPTPSRCNASALFTGQVFSRARWLRPYNPADPGGHRAETSLLSCHVCRDGRLRSAGMPRPAIVATKTAPGEGTNPLAETRSDH